MNNNRATALDFYRKAVEADQNRNPDAPDLKYQLLSSAVVADPTMTMGFYELANTNGDNRWRASAVALHKRALELPDGTDPGDMTAEWRGKSLTNLSHQLHHLGRNDEAKKAAMHALRMNDKLANAWLNLSLIHRVEGNLDEAINCARKAMALERTPAIELALAFALMYSGKYAEGLRHFQCRVEYVLRHFLSYPYPRWQGEKDKTIFLVADQGMGDTLSFARFVPMMAERCKKVQMRIQPELVRLFKVFFQKYPNIVIEPMPCPFPVADHWSTFMCLPTALGLNDEQIVNTPGLPCPQFDIGSSWKSSDRDFHIGVAWAGSKANWINHWRSFPIEHLLDLYDVPGIQLYSLQFDDAAQDIHSTGSAVLIRDMKPFVRDVSDTIGMLKHLDLVISCESVVPHICALTGTECWIPYSHHGNDFRIGTTEKGQLWNPHARIFKQHRDGRWDSVFVRIKDMLRSRIEVHRRRLSQAAE